MPRYFVTVGPESAAEHPGAPTPTWLIEAGDEGAARDHAEVRYRRAHAEVEHVRLRVTQEPDS